MMAPKILLASSSTYRHELLRKLRLDFVWAAPNIDETPLFNETGATLVQRLSRAKAESMATQYPDHLIIGADQVAILDGRIIGKPLNHVAAKAQLLSFRNRTLSFLTGLSLYNARTRKCQAHIETNTVSFKDLSEAQVDKYLHMDKPYDCAGSFKAEGLGICLFAQLTGRDPNALTGLPLIALIEMLNSEGIDPLG